MAVTKHDPFHELLVFPRYFEEAFSWLISEPSSARPWSPPTDIYETENELVLKADLPDVDMKDLDIRMEGGTLTLKGERKFEKDTGERGYHRLERGYGSFRRAFTIPETVDSGKISAEFTKGVLTITMPKKPVAKRPAIKVRVKD